MHFPIVFKLSNGSGKFFTKKINNISELYQHLLLINKNSELYNAC
jgi:hypothetical protein